MGLTGNMRNTHPALHRAERSRQRTHLRGIAGAAITFTATALTFRLCLQRQRTRQPDEESAAKQEHNV